MRKHAIPLLLLALLLNLHAQLWLGRGSVFSVSQLRNALEAQKTANAQAAVENERLTAEINDLKVGLEIVEEKARSELGMVKSNEIFVQIAK
ncbi:MAG: septum formation initiator family protein [Rhodoferax sp.]|nr:septum formation initiator family protein [Rhodoferax sp.]